MIWNNEKKIAGSHASYISAQPCSAPVHWRTKGQTERCVRWALQCRALFSSVQKVQCLVKIKPQITILALTGRSGLKRFLSKKKALFNSETAISLDYGVVTSRLKIIISKLEKFIPEQIQNHICWENGEENFTTLWQNFKVVVQSLNYYHNLTGFFEWFWILLRNIITSKIKWE